MTDERAWDRNLPPALTPSLGVELARWAFLDPETGDWIEVKPGTVHGPLSCPAEPAASGEPDYGCANECCVPGTPCPRCGEFCGEVAIRAGSSLDAGPLVTGGRITRLAEPPQYTEDDPDWAAAVSPAVKPDTVFAGPHNGCTYERPHVHPEDSPEVAHYLAPLDEEMLKEALTNVAREVLFAADGTTMRQRFSAIVAREYTRLSKR